MLNFKVKNKLFHVGLTKLNEWEREIRQRSLCLSLCVKWIAVGFLGNTLGGARREERIVHSTLGLEKWLGSVRYCQRHRSVRSRGCGCHCQCKGNPSPSLDAGDAVRQVQPVAQALLVLKVEFALDLRGRRRLLLLYIRSRSE